MPVQCSLLQLTQTGTLPHKTTHNEEAIMPARIRHIALSVKDIDATADFYEKAFGLKRSPKSEGPTAYRVYMSDGEINLALLQYKSEVGSGLTNPNSSFRFPVRRSRRAAEEDRGSGRQIFL